ncbi:MAG: bifunctional diguanylate cyclase/phosphodiesterase [Pseudomonadota bacterium]
MSAEFSPTPSCGEPVGQASEEPPSLTEAQRASADAAQEALRLERRCRRERAARREAERLLEEKSSALYEANQRLATLNADLETVVAERTEALRDALAEAEAAKARSEREAMHDPLTGLPNRRYLRAAFEKMTGAARAEGKAMAALHLDLDRFKLINDTIGHAAGDHVLLHVGRVLSESAAGRAFVSRVGGDEFVLLMLFDGDLAEVTAFAESIVRDLSLPIPYGASQLRVCGSFGVAHARGDAINAGALLANADRALYLAKGRGRGVVAHYSGALEQAIRDRKALGDEIDDAIRSRAFEPFYQLRVDARTHEVRSVEALARWRHPDRGVLGPGAFIEIAEDHRVIHRIDDIILERALGDLAAWRAFGLDIPRISVNVSADRLSQSNLLERLKALALPASSVSFELLETIFLEQAAEADFQRLQALRDLGVALELDDFGSGHSSILSLTQVRPRTIKIDRRLVQGLGSVESSGVMVRAIVEIAAALQVRVVAEGVETGEQAALCAALGCDELQGFAICRPLPASALAARARDIQREPAAALGLEGAA